MLGDDVLCRARRHLKLVWAPSMQPAAENTGHGGPVNPCLEPHAPIRQDENHAKRPPASMQAAEKRNLRLRLCSRHREPE